MSSSRVTLGALVGCAARAGIIALAYVSSRDNGKTSSHLRLLNLTTPSHLILASSTLYTLIPFQEGYYRHFSFIKHVPRLLQDQNSQFSYFNEHAAKRKTAYEVVVYIQLLCFSFIPHQCFYLWILFTLAHQLTCSITNQIYTEVAWLHHNDLGMNTKWSSSSWLHSTSLVTPLMFFLLIYHSPMTTPHPFCIPPEVYIDEKTRWENILERGRGVSRDHPHLIPICTLVPMVPQTGMEASWGRGGKCRCGQHGVWFRIAFQWQSRIAWIR